MVLETDWSMLEAGMFIRCTKNIGGAQPFFNDGRWHEIADVESVYNGGAVIIFKNGAVGDICSLCGTYEYDYSDPADRVFGTATIDVKVDQPVRIGAVIW